jgi:hypothetical protein
MDETEWSNQNRHAQLMLRSLGDLTNTNRTKAGKRRLRLFACACCRLVWDLLEDPRQREAVALAEAAAEGRANNAELQRAHEDDALRVFGRGVLTADAPGVLKRTAGAMVHALLHPKASTAAFYMTAYSVALPGYRPDGRSGESILCDLIRCIFGNPFRPLTLAPALLRWNDGTLRQLAQSAYDERQLPSGAMEPTRLGVLADALEDAGCKDATMLEHLRAPGPHPRGCHVVDALRGVK